MTEPNSITVLKECFIKAGFVDSVSLLANICHTPDRVFVMNNSYAVVVVCQASLEECATASSLVEVKDQMHDFIRNALLALENKKGLIVDAYLLIALNQEPDTDVNDAVRNIELDTKVCRKHVVWPVENGDSLDRLQFITILSLPELLFGSATNTTPFELSAEANAVLTKYDELGSLDRLLDAIKNGELVDAN